jgi:tetratricopeptide (TPR) repeat protein
MISATYFMISTAQVDGLFSAIPTSQAQRDSLSNSALSRGIDRYTSDDYGGAVTEFRRAIGLSPFSDNTAKAYDYTARAYTLDGNTEAAIKTYQEAIKSYPTRAAFHTSLGDIYYKQGQLSEAEAEYKAAINLDSESTDSRYGLGQVYLNSERVDEAETQFKEVVRLSPGSSIGYYGLGQTYRKRGITVMRLPSLIRPSHWTARLMMVFLSRDTPMPTWVTWTMPAVWSLRCPITDLLQRALSFSTSTKVQHQKSLWFTAPMVLKHLWDPAHPWPTWIPRCQPVRRPKPLR